MEKIQDIDIKLYGALYDPCSVDNSKEIWDEIRLDRDILCEAIELENDNESLKGISIASLILDYPEQVDEDIYSQLINTIYSNKDIARISIDNEGNTFLFKTLKNFDLDLTDDQKHFAVSEAMQMHGTTLYKSEMEKFASNVDDGESVRHFDTLEHGIGDFDIRYFILRNPNWSITEKSKLIYDFFVGDQEYDNRLRAWELDIVNDDANYDEIGLLDKDILYDYNLSDLTKIYHNEEIAKRIMNEIKFCKLMHKLRPQLWELYDDVKVNVKR